MMPERLPRCSEHPSSEHGTCKVHFVDDNSALQQVQYAIERFHEAPLEESARRAYRIALARGDADVAYRLMLNLWDNRSAREHQDFRDRIYAAISPEIAKSRILQCTRAHIIQRGATVLSQSGPDGPVGLQGSIADLQFGIDTAQKIYDSAVSDGDWKTTAELLPGPPRSQRGCRENPPMDIRLSSEYGEADGNKRSRFSHTRQASAPC